MRQQLRTSAIMLALLASCGLASAQGTPGGAQGQLNLSPSQEQSVGRGVASQPKQAPPSGYQSQMGGKAPEGLAPQPLPNQVTEQVPETKGYLFVKLPDRVLLIDPATQMVAEIVMISETTGTGGATGPMGSSPAR